MCFCMRVRQNPKHSEVYFAFAAARPTRGRFDCRWVANLWWWFVLVLVLLWFKIKAKPEPKPKQTGFQLLLRVGLLWDRKSANLKIIKQSILNLAVFQKYKFHMCFCMCVRQNPKHSEVYFAFAAATASMQVPHTIPGRGVAAGGPAHSSAVVSAGGMGSGSAGAFGP